MADHAAQCCRLHGCLLDGKCPVEVGGIMQEGPCALCPPVGKVGWDNGTSDLLRCVADLIDENSEAKPGSPWVDLPHLGDVMRKMQGRCNPKFVACLLHLLGGTAHEQTSGSLQPVGVDHHGELELGIQVESGDQIHAGSVFVSRDMWEELTKYFDHRLGTVLRPAFPLDNSDPKT